MFAQVSNEFFLCTKRGWPLQDIVLFHMVPQTDSLPRGPDRVLHADSAGPGGRTNVGPGDRTPRHALPPVLVEKHALHPQLFRLRKYGNFFFVLISLPEFLTEKLEVQLTSRIPGLPYRAKRSLPNPFLKLGV